MTARTISRLPKYALVLFDIDLKTSIVPVSKIDGTVQTGYSVKVQWRENQKLKRLDASILALSDNLSSLRKAEEDRCLRLDQSQPSTSSAETEVGATNEGQRASTSKRKTTNDEEVSRPPKKRTRKKVDKPKRPLCIEDSGEPGRGNDGYESDGYVDRWTDIVQLSDDVLADVHRQVEDYRLSHNLPKTAETQTTPLQTVDAGTQTSQDESDIEWRRKIERKLDEVLAVLQNQAPTQQTRSPATTPAPSIPPPTSLQTTYRQLNFTELSPISSCPPLSPFPAEGPSPTISQPYDAIPPQIIERSLNAASSIGNFAKRLVYSIYTPEERKNRTVSGNSAKGMSKLALSPRRRDLIKDTVFTHYPQHIPASERDATWKRCIIDIDKALRKY